MLGPLALPNEDHDTAWLFSIRIIEIPDWIGEHRQYPGFSVLNWRNLIQEVGLRIPDLL